MRRIWAGGVGLLLGWLAGPVAMAQLPELPPEPPAPTSPSPEPMPSPSPGDAAPPDTDAMPPVLRGPLRETIACPTDLTDLTPLLIRDVPTYANRVLQRSLGDVPDTGDGPPLAQYRPSYVLLAGQTEVAPLDMTDRIYTTDLDAGEHLEQLFFTTLERTYNRAELIEITHYHWLFLAPDEKGWRLALMFSAIDSQDDGRPILPPQESSNGSVGRGVELWLRNCRAGAIAG